MIDVVGASISRCRWLASVLTAAVGIVLFSVAPAHALPPAPLAPTCQQYGFNGTLSINQDNGLRVDITGWSGQTAPSGNSAALLFLSDGTPAKVDNDGNPDQHGPARYSLQDPFRPFDTQQIGDVHGGIEGNQMSFTVDWDLRVPVSNEYSGTINANGQGASGVTRNTQGVSNKWSTFATFDCVTEAAAPAPVSAPPDTRQVRCTGRPDLGLLPPGTDCAKVPPPATPPAPYLVQIQNGAVDIYAQPCGVGKPFDSLPEGTNVHVLTRQPAGGQCGNWVNVVEEIHGKAATGWVWGDYVPQ